MNANVSDVMGPPGRVETLHGRLADLLDALDEAQLHGPAAYVSMALDTIQRDYPELSATR
jgi:hypothetical protein